jgi:glutathione S-transferase
MLKLVIGDRNYSSWSLRPWLAIKQAELPFEEVYIRLRGIGTKAEIFKYSPSGKVPCLIDGDTVVWDSLAICEYLAETKPALWPAERRARAEARSVCAEMHSGFNALRQFMPMQIHASKPYDERTAEVKADIARIVTIWESCRARFAAGGPFLFGTFSIADAMFAPVVWRFLTYVVELPATSRDWVEMMCALPAMQEWRAAALAEAD